MLQGVERITDAQCRQFKLAWWPGAERLSGDMQEPPAPEPPAPESQPPLPGSLQHEATRVHSVQCASSAVPRPVALVPVAPPPDGDHPVAIDEVLAASGLHVSGCDVPVAAVAFEHEGLVLCPVADAESPMTTAAAFVCLDMVQGSTSSSSSEDGMDGVP